MKKFFFIIFTVFLVFSYNPSLEAQERNYYQELVNEWSKICLLYTSDAADE